MAIAPVLEERAQTLFITGYKSLNLTQVADSIGLEHIAYGSGAPLHYPESALLQVMDADLDREARSRILFQNGRTFLGLDGDDRAS